MNTPSHAIINLALLANSSQPDANLFIVLGGILPDIPIFVFYGWAKFIAKMPESQIWSDAYNSQHIQRIVAIFHSIPLAILAWAIAFKLGWLIAQVLCISIIWHNLLDFPVHNDDAHRHFFPLSNYRFISPISYWDPRHYGSLVSLMELLLVLWASYTVFFQVRSPLGQTLILLVNLLYTGGYSYHILKRTRKQTHHPINRIKTAILKKIAP
ncbi:hypothetical protein H4N54_17580 [Limnospira fusiformis KN01]|uniref:Metal-dependent hydrolase n=1 Tax=Limnospira fusiformis PMC 851.14 TaxID=2219512 RepID=A0ABU9ET18_LIMFS|nr:MULTISPECIES: hypothetical protein [Limnospira]MDT9190159.1 hypothetical protein [Limnospira sp. PMC 894.15]MDT9236113.1 hypothetical protein [Limnospira sp. PMC 917.15]MDT9276969.1 hypothetical protein [Limnospira sp. PMC 737.11]ULB44248.1 hypothetical protein H4N54_17580 [Limnospira fusiformis KN01]